MKEIRSASAYVMFMPRSSDHIIAERFCGFDLYLRL